ncbi:STAS domain-containing protein [bacterium]|nr:STAS domain-containing protein [bacterium]
MEFKVNVKSAKWDPDLTVLEIHGSVDAQTAPAFEKTAMEVIGKNRRRILVDCAGLDFISSAGIGVFMVILSEVESSGGLWIMNLSDEVFESFDLLGIPEVVKIFKNEKEAQAGCK